MSDETAIVPYVERRVFQIGDGDTRFTLPGERPLSSEEKYEKSVYEAMADFRNAMTDLAITLADTVEGLFAAWSILNGREVAEVPKAKVNIPAVKKVEPKAVARERSRDDLKRKRKELIKQRGRR